MRNGISSARAARLVRATQTRQTGHRAPQRQSRGAGWYDRPIGPSGAPAARQGVTLTDSAAVLTKAQRDELGRIAAAGQLPASAIPEFFARVERVIARQIGRNAPPIVDVAGQALARALDWRDAALARITDQAAQLFRDLDALRTAQQDWGFPDRLGPELACFTDPDTAARLNALDRQARETWLREQGPERLAETIEMLAHLAEAAREAQWQRPSPGPGAPPRHDALLDGLECAVIEACAPEGGEQAGEDWEAAWAPWTAAKGPFGRLVGLALQAAGEPPHSNLHKLIGAWQQRSRAAFDRELAESASREAGRAVTSDPPTGP